MFASYMKQIILIYKTINLFNILLVCLKPVVHHDKDIGA